MSKKQWLVLLLLFVMYLLLGAAIFYHIESREEIQKVQQARLNRIEINALLHEHYMPDAQHDQHEILDKLTSYCGKSVYNYTEGEVDSLKWDFYNSFYFAYTVVSTIGYGNLAPTIMLSRILMIFYGLVGIPMNGIVLTQLGEYFGNVFIRAHKKYKSYKDGHGTQEKLAHLENRKAGLAVQILMYLLPGFVMFIFFPAFLFCYYEGWMYDEAVYYAFVTLTTIGFGDYVAGQDNTKGSGVFFILYKIFLIFWISFGLGYLVMIMGFIARGMRSKRITRIEHKLAMNLKTTQSKIWNEFNKDVQYLQRVFNELYMMKLKPVYRDDYDYDAPPINFPRSNSFPDLRDLMYGGLETPVPIHPRRRANSEVVPIQETLTRVVSETDLQRIDKNATFASHAMVQPAELLARLVNALGYMPPPPDDFDEYAEGEENPEQRGFQGFSDKEILASERSWNGSGWRIGGEKPSVPKPRARAASEVRLQKDESKVHQENGDWTWSGPAASKKIQELITARRRSGTPGSKDSKSKFPFQSVPKTIFPSWPNPFSNKKFSSDQSRRDSVLDGDINTRADENYLSHTSTSQSRQLRLADRRRSTATNYLTHTGGNLPISPDGNLLEETSLADFLRALTSLHTRVGAVPDEFVPRPQRKMGTASMTPPKLPSLLTLFSPPTGTTTPNQSHQNTFTAGQNAARRFSLRPAENSENSVPSYQRKGSLIHSGRPRRFSLRPVVTPLHTTPPYTPDVIPPHILERQNPPPYSADPFIFECPKESFVPLKGAPSISPPMRSSPTPRRFSLRSAQIGVPPSPATPKTPPMNKPVPRWKAGMLQRQINELNLQRRARAFSLSDVHMERFERPFRPSPLAMPNKLTNEQKSTGEKDPPSGKDDKTNPPLMNKSVTIMSPSSWVAESNNEKQSSGRTNSANVPESFVDTGLDISASQEPQSSRQQSQLPLMHYQPNLPRHTKHSHSIELANKPIKSSLSIGQSNKIPSSSNCHSTDENIPVDSKRLVSKQEDVKLLQTSASSDESHPPSALDSIVIDDFVEISQQAPAKSPSELKGREITSSGAAERETSRSAKISTSYSPSETLDAMYDMNKMSEMSVDNSSAEQGPTISGNINLTAQYPTDVGRLPIKKISTLKPSIDFDKSPGREVSSVSLQYPTVGHSVTDFDKFPSRIISTISQNGTILVGRSTVAEDPVNREIPTVSKQTIASEIEKSYSRKISTISQRSTASAGSTTNVEKSENRKISTISQQGIASESSPGSRKNSTTAKSPFDRPRVSIESYKPLLEIKIEKPTTNPFEQYRVTMESKLDKPKERMSPDSGKVLIEVKTDKPVVQFKHSGRVENPTMLESNRKTSCKSKHVHDLPSDESGA